MLVITGASGQLGRAVAEHVLRTVADPGAVVLATRHPDSLDGLANGAQVRRADFDDPAGLAAAFAGGTRLLLISADDVERRAGQHAAAIDAAAAAGVRHVVYTSMIAPGPDNPALISPSHWATEQHLRGSGLAWTMLRCGLYADFQVAEAAAALASGRLVHNRGAGRCAYVTRADCATAAAAVLTGDGHEGVSYDLTGPDALGAAELAACYADVGGAQVELEAVDDAELTARLAGADPDGHARYGAALVVSLGRATRAGHFAQCTNAVRELTGRSPCSVRDLLCEHRDTLRAAVARP